MSKTSSPLSDRSIDVLSTENDQRVRPRTSMCLGNSYRRKCTCPWVDVLGNHDYPVKKKNLGSEVPSFSLGRRNYFTIIMCPESGDFLKETREVHRWVVPWNLVINDIVSQIFVMIHHHDSCRSHYFYSYSGDKYFGWSRWNDTNFQHRVWRTWL